jgi:hypothetical protein
MSMLITTAGIMSAASAKPAFTMMHAIRILNLMNRKSVSVQKGY